VHHVSKQLAGTEADLEVQLIVLLKVNQENALKALQKWEGPITLQVKVQGANYLPFEHNQLFTSDLFAQRRWQAFNHHVEARVHMLVHFGRHQNADRGQLNKVWGTQSMSRKYGEEAICDANCQVKSVLSVAFHAVQLLDECNH